MKIWITGLAGFLGSHLADALVAEGHEVWGNDNLICGNKNNIRHIIDFDKQYIVGNIPLNPDCCNYDDMYKILSAFKPDVLVHCAATAHEGLSSFSPSFITRNIYEASVATFSAAIAAGVKRIVFMSSMSRYGNGTSRMHIHGNGNDTTIKVSRTSAPFIEEHFPSPVDPYAVAKVAAEDTLRILAGTHGVAYSILVPHNIIGTRQRYVDPFRNVASIMINRCLQGKAPIIYGDGMQMRCFSPIVDCIPSIINAVNGAADGEIVNIGPDTGTITINHLAYKIIELTGFKSEPIYMPERPNEVKDAYCSSDKARRMLGYSPKQSIDDCLEEMVVACEPKPFVYDFPIEIEKGCPQVWLEKMQ